MTTDRIFWPAQDSEERDFGRLLLVLLIVENMASLPRARVKPCCLGDEFKEGSFWAGVSWVPSFHNFPTAAGFEQEKSGMASQVEQLTTRPLLEDDIPQTVLKLIQSPVCLLLSRPDIRFLCAVRKYRS
jgi:hypothetical protein